jgi:signal transduction histidine kinase
MVYLPLFTADDPLALVTLYRMKRAIEPAALPVPQLRQATLDLFMSLTDISSTQNRKFIDRQTEQIRNIADADWCEIAIRDDSPNGLRTILSCGEIIWTDGAQPSLKLADYPRLAELLNEQQSFSGTPTTDLRALLNASNGRSLLIVPLVIKGETAGLVILADTLRERHFTPRDMRLAHALVMQAANAIDNARLYHDLQISLEELHQTQNRLVQAARMAAMGELAAAVAHQINNPLTTVLGDTEIVLRDLPPDDANRESLEAVFRAGKRAHEVVRRLLTMARQQPADEQMEAVNVNETIRNTLALAKGHIQRGSVKFNVELEDNLPPVAAPPGQLEDVWLNLLLNANDALVGSEQPRMGIQSARRGEQVEVTVWDNGTGIPESMQEQVFEPFFTTKPAGEGTGLGLRICQQIVQKCRGSIHLKSVYNEGTKFIVTLPIFSENWT